MLGLNGYTMPAERDVLIGVLADMDAAFGGNLNPALETPQGQLASSNTAIIGDKDDQFLAITQGVDPAYATGRMQDGIARIYFIERLPARPTTVFLVCTGLAGAAIPAGALVTAPDGNQYAATAGGSFAVDGTVTLPFACVVTGPIVAPASSAWTIYRTITGWDTAVSVTDGVIGADTETRAAFELRRQASVAHNGRNTLAAIQGEVLQVANLLDAYTTANNSGSPLVVDGVTLPAHSVYVCVAGGDPADVAAAIWSKIPPGPDMAGDTTQTVIDSNAGYSFPQPSYLVTFQTAVPTTFVFLVGIATSSQVPSNAAALIQDAILTAFSGADGGPRARIGSDVYASRFYSAVATLGPWAQITSIHIGSTATPAATFTASVAGTVMTVTAVASGTLAVGQFVIATGLPDGLRIVSLGTGAGGTGTYNVSSSVTSTSGTKVSVAATLDKVTVGIAHVPVTAAGNIVTVIV